MILGDSECEMMIDWSEGDSDRSRESGSEICERVREVRFGRQMFVWNEFEGAGETMTSFCMDWGM